MRNVNNNNAIGIFFVQLLSCYFLLGNTSDQWAFAFTPTTTTTSISSPVSLLSIKSTTKSASSSSSSTSLQAGGFEWTDPTDDSQSVTNPFTKKEDEDVMKQQIDEMKEDGSTGSSSSDPARMLGPRLQGSNIYLIGMMGSGKSSVGDKLARRMGTYKFLDTDDIIEKATSMSIPELFALEEGEDGFRTVESQVLDTVHSYVRCVVSTGGGMVCVNQNWGKLQTGIVIWLDVSPTLIYDRLKNSKTDRPLLQTDDPLKTLETLLEERQSKYSQADFRVEITDASMNEDQVASQIVLDLHNYLDDHPPAWKVAKQQELEANE